MSHDAPTRRRFLQVAGVSTAVALAGCTGSDGGNEQMEDEQMTDDDGEMTTEEEMTEDEEMNDMSPTDPNEAPMADVDRFSEAAGTLLVRSEDNDLPGPDEPIDFDQGPFITQGLGPDGEVVEYYNFDVMPTAPAPIFAFFHENGDPVEDQLNVVGVIPGDDGYNDFWHVHTVTVPDDYEANTVTSVGGIGDADYDVESTSTIKNCPIVPAGSTASKHHGDHDEAPVVEGWYDGEVVEYFLFEEDEFEEMGGSMPTSPIYVSFNANPGTEGGGPASGFMTEEMSDQTHNVVTTLPGDDGYSPLWAVNVYDNEDFDDVSDLSSAMDAAVLDDEGPTVNCPVVSVE